MFKLATSRLSKAPFIVRYIDEEGEIVENTIILTAELLPRDSFKEFDEGTEAIVELARTTLRGWEGVGDEDGKPLPFNDENRDRFLNAPGIATYDGYFSWYVKLWSGQGQALEKNSVASRADGREEEAEAAEAASKSSSTS